MSLIKRFMSGRTRIATLSAVAVLILVLAAVSVMYIKADTIVYVPEENLAQTTAVPVPVVPEKIKHISTPERLHAVYLTSWAAGNDKFRKELFDLVDKTEVNAVVIDVKDYSGHISFHVKDPVLAEFGASENRIPDIDDFIDKLHEKGVYVIGRVSTFQDSYLVKIHPEWSVQTKAGGIWADYKGVKWLDAGAKPVWDYLTRIARESYARGFDEINFDYIRFPSDGPMKDVKYSWQNGETRQVVMQTFFKYLHESLKDLGAPISVDFFGLTTSAEDDLGIGQVLGDALMNFDYVAPMVYPSHFGTGFIGHTKPATAPYEVVNYSMNKAVEKAFAASSTPAKLRPWLQAFDLGAVYTPAMVRAQVQATYDAGLNSWMLWNAASVYNPEFFAEAGTSTEGK
jgi:hypothetical protein